MTDTPDTQPDDFDMSRLRSDPAEQTNLRLQAMFLILASSTPDHVEVASNVLVTYLTKLEEQYREAFSYADTLTGVLDGTARYLVDLAFAVRDVTNFHDMQGDPDDNELTFRLTDIEPIPLIMARMMDAYYRQMREQRQKTQVVGAVEDILRQMQGEKGT